jgi:hypothetical protein
VVEVVEPTATLKAVYHLSKPPGIHLSDNPVCMQFGLTD